MFMIFPHQFFYHIIIVLFALVGIHLFYGSTPSNVIYHTTFRDIINERKEYSVIGKNFINVSRRRNLSEIILTLLLDF